MIKQSAIHSAQSNDVLTVQVVLRVYDSPAEILLGFDVDCACMGFDGRSVWALPRCIRALRSGTNVLNPLHAWPNRATYEFRLAKYATRGFAVAVPGLDVKVEDLMYLNSAKLEDLRGLARLLKIAMVTSASVTTFRGRGGSEADRYLALKKSPIDPLACSVLRNRHEIVGWDDAVCKGLMESAYNEEESTIVPSVFSVRATQQEATTANGVPQTLLYYASLVIGDELHNAQRTKLLAWSEINDAGQTEEWTDLSLPRKLDDAWDTSKRSREYLNAADGELEPRYYVHASNLTKPAVVELK